MCVCGSCIKECMGRDRWVFTYKSNHTITCILVQIALQQIRIGHNQIYKNCSILSIFYSHSNASTAFSPLLVCQKNGINWISFFFYSQEYIHSNSDEFHSPSPLNENARSHSELCWQLKNSVLSLKKLQTKRTSSLTKKQRVQPA